MSTQIKVTQRADVQQKQELKHEVIEEHVSEMEDGTRRIQRTTATQIQTKTFTQAIEQEFSHKFQTLMLCECENTPEALWRIQCSQWRNRLLHDFDPDREKQTLTLSRLLNNLKVRVTWFKKALENNVHGKDKVTDNYLENQGDLVMLYMIKDKWQDTWFTFDPIRIGLLENQYKPVDGKFEWPDKSLKVVGVLTSSTNEQFDVAIPVVAARRIMKHQHVTEQQVLEKFIKVFKDQGIPPSLLTYEAQLAQHLSRSIKDKNVKELSDMDYLLHTRRFITECDRIIHANKGVDKYIDQDCLTNLRNAVVSCESQLGTQDTLKCVVDDLSVLDHVKNTPEVLELKDNLNNRKMKLLADWAEEIWSDSE